MATLIRINHPSMPYSVIIDDDDRVAYAYLLRDEVIVSDVWLYNCGETPAAPEWSDPTKAPFANPLGFASELRGLPITKEDDVSANWQESMGDVGRVELIAHGQLLAVLAIGAKPGWSANAIKNGPLARILDGVN